MANPALIAALKSPPSLPDAFKNIQTFASQIQEFDQNMDYNAQLNGLQGYARTVGQQIHDTIVPKLKVHGSKLQAGVQVATQAIKGLVDGFVQTASFMKTTTDSNAIQQYLSNVVIAVSNTSADLDALNSEFNDYHNDVNSLISAFNSEEAAIQQDRENLENERKATLQKLYDKTHTACGVIKSIGEALIGKLQSDIQSIEDSLRANEYKYRFDTLAIGSLNNMVNLSSTFQSNVEQQHTQFVALNTNVGILANDLNDLLQDMSDWDIEWQGVHDDWSNLQKLFNA